MKEKVISLTGTVLRSTWVAGYKAGPDFIKNVQYYSHLDIVMVKYRLRVKTNIVGSIQ